MSWGNNGPYCVDTVSGGHGHGGQYSSYTVGCYVGETGSSKHDTAGKKPLTPSSRLKKATHDVVHHYPSSYAYNSNHYRGTYGYNGSSSRHSYSSRSEGGYKNKGDSYNSAAYGSGTYGEGGGAIPYWSSLQDGTRSPMFISTKEVNVYGAMPGSSQNEQKQRRGGGFFRPALEAIGHFFDRKLGFHDRD